MTSKNDMPRVHVKLIDSFIDKSTDPMQQTNTHASDWFHPDVPYVASSNRLPNRMGGVQPDTPDVSGLEAKLEGAGFSRRPERHLTEGVCCMINDPSGRNISFWTHPERTMVGGVERLLDGAGFKRVST